MNQTHLDFDQYGYLTPYQPISMDLPTFERVFVQELPQSTTRRMLFNRYQEYNARLSEFLPNFTQWIDGSFVSRKLNPNDIDLLTFVDSAMYEKHEQAIAELKQWRLRRPKFIDGFSFERIQRVISYAATLKATVCNGCLTGVGQITIPDAVKG